MSMKRLIKKGRKSEEKKWNGGKKWMGKEQKSPKYQGNSLSNDR